MASPERVQDVFSKIAALSPVDRPAAIERECGQDEELRRRVEALLHARDDAKPFRALANILLIIGCLGATITCLATAIAAVDFYRQGHLISGLACFPFGFLMAAANAVLFWRVFSLSTQRQKETQ